MYTWSMSKVSPVNVPGTQTFYFPRGACIFYRGTDPGSNLIAAGSGSYWTHCAVACGDGTAIAAQWGGPVRFQGDVSFTIPCQAFTYPGDTETLLASLKASLAANTPYDYAGLLGIPGWNLFRLCADPGLKTTKARFCSTLMAEAFKADAAFKLPWPNKPLHVITPQDLYNMFSEAP